MQLGRKLAHHRAGACRVITRDHQQVAPGNVGNAWDGDGLGEDLQRIERRHLRGASQVMRRPSTNLENKRVVPDFGSGGFTRSRGRRNFYASRHSVAASNRRKPAAGVLLYLSCPKLALLGTISTVQPSFSRSKAVYTRKKLLKSASYVTIPSAPMVSTR